MDTSCDEKRGHADHDAFESGAGFPFNLTTPSNFRQNVRHPLLVVWAPAMAGPWLSERMTGLTHQATRAGFIVAYAGAIRMTTKNVLALESITQTILNQWCVDPKSIFYTGHSDGGTVAMALALLPEAKIRPRAIAPSAMGMDNASLAAYDCPPLTDVLILHNSDDDHFPDFGKEAAEWWASCQQCDRITSEVNTSGCSEYSGCLSGRRVLYCEGVGGHLRWGGTNHDVIRFFVDSRGTSFDPR